MRSDLTIVGSVSVDPTEALLRRLASNDQKALKMVLARGVGDVGDVSLNPKLETLVELAALLAVGAATPLLRETVAQASAEGATTNEIVDVLVAVGPAVGLASLVACARRLAMAIGYDLENGRGRYPGHNREGGGARSEE